MASPADLVAYYPAHPADDPEFLSIPLPLVKPCFCIYLDNGLCPDRITDTPLGLHRRLLPYRPTHNEICAAYHRAFAYLDDRIQSVGIRVAQYNLDLKCLTSRLHRSRPHLIQCTHAFSRLLEKHSTLQESLADLCINYHDYINTNVIVQRVPNRVCDVCQVYPIPPPRPDSEN